MRLYSTADFTRKPTPTMALRLPVSVLCLCLPVMTIAQGDIAPDLEARLPAETVIRYERQVGNARAQARRQGVIHSVPQIFVYHTDRTPALYLSDYSDDLPRAIDSALAANRVVRDMAGLLRLLGEVRTAGGRRVLSVDLDEADVYVVEYWKPECPDCRRMRERVVEWIETRDREAVFWIRVEADPERRPAGR